MMLHYIHTYKCRKEPKNGSKNGLRKWGLKNGGKRKKETIRKIVKIVVMLSLFEKGREK